MKSNFHFHINSTKTRLTLLDQAVVGMDMPLKDFKMEMDPATDRTPRIGKWKAGYSSLCQEEVALKK